MTTGLRQLDPRTLLAAAMGAAFCFSFVRGVAPACLCLAAALLLAIARRLPARPLLKRLAAANLFILFLWLTVPFSMPEGGARLALLVTLKCNAILLSFSALAHGISPPRVGCALERLRLPPKLVFLFLFTCRYIHVVGDEWRRLWTAAKLRGFIPRNSLHTYRTIGSMLGLSFVSAVDRSKRVYEAMLLRGFAGSFRMAAEQGPGNPRADALFSAAFFLCLCGILLLDAYRG